jgi:hypothetical protein
VKNVLPPALKLAPAAPEPSRIPEPTFTSTPEPIIKEEVKPEIKEEIIKPEIQQEIQQVVQEEVRVKRHRCPDGTRKNKKTGNCEPKR